VEERLSHRLAGPAGQGALHLEEGTADLVAEGGVALLVLHAAVEEAARPVVGGLVGLVVVMHFGLVVWWVDFESL
jgi:hypothetical protein